MQGLAVGWCDLRPSGAVEPRRIRGHSIRSEVAGYLAMLAFLAAYLLNVAGVGPMAQAALNLSGGIAGATYLLGKHAVPSVISNLTWVAITLLGLIIQRPF